MAGKQIRVGVLALQGDFKEHSKKIETLGHISEEIRLAEQLENIDSLIIPGGESTAISKLIKDYDLIEPIKAFAQTKPVWGTCAGLILIANDQSTNESVLNLIDIKVKRNAFGRQLDSFVSDLQINDIENCQNPFSAVFIRAPIITEVGKQVEVLSKLSSSEIVAARQGNIFATCFHPELTDDLRVHKYFLSFK